MAEIPIKEKGGIPWWVWLLLAAIIAALLIWWISGDGDDEARAVDPVAVESSEPVAMGGATDTGNAAAGTTGGAITDMAMLMPAISDDMVGRQFRLDGVQIQEVVGDIGFWIGPSADQRVFAVLTQEKTPSTAMEGEADVNQGARANVSGTIRTRGEIIQDFAEGDVAALPQGVNHFLVVENYQVASGA